MNAEIHPDAGHYQLAHCAPSAGNPVVQRSALQEGIGGDVDRDTGTSPVPPATPRLQAPQEHPVLVLKCRHLLTLQPKISSYDPNTYLYHT